MFVFVSSSYVLYALTILQFVTGPRFLARLAFSDPRFQYLSYGSLDRTMLTLFQSVTGGLDWANAVHPLMEHVNGIWTALIFTVYVAFAALAMQNVVTGVLFPSD